MNAADATRLYIELKDIDVRLNQIREMLEEDGEEILPGKLSRVSDRLFDVYHEIYQRS